MEPTQETNNESAVPEVAVVAAPKVKMITWFKAGWTFTKARKDLITWYFVSLAALAVFSSEIPANSFGGPVELLFGIGLFVSIIFLMLNGWAVLYAVTQESRDTITYKESFSWASSNFFPLLWTSIVSSVTIFLGYVLLIIPGIIATIYFYFALYCQATGGGVGTKALKASYRVVKGKWWSVLWKLIVLGFYVVLIYIAAAIVFAILLAVGGENEWVELILDVLMQGLVGGVISVMSMYTIAHYFGHLNK